MATREDVVVDYAPELRIAVVEHPSTEFVIQDIVDTLRKREDTFQGQSNDKLINASGKESIGGGVFVGITAELQSAQIAFEGRTDPAQTGTVTTASLPPIANSRARSSGLIQLIDGNAAFITNKVTRGSLVINFTDLSIAEVYQVLTETILYTRTLVNGTDNSFDIGDDYHIFNIVQCEVLGGNIVGVDNNGDAVSPITPTAFTQIIRSASSSATIIGGIPSPAENAQAVWEHEVNGVVEGSMGEIQKRSAFGDHVHVSENDGLDGTDYPLGTHGHPVKTIADAVIIALREVISEIWVDEDITVFSTDNISGLTIIGPNAIKSQITIQPGATTQLSRFNNCNVQGQLGGRVAMSNCVVDTLTNFEGAMINCVLQSGGIQLSSTANAISFILDCYSGVPGQGAAEIDYNNTEHKLAIRAYAGGLKFLNRSIDQPTSVDFISGQLILDGTVIAGETVVRGIYHLENNSTGTSFVTQNTNLDVIEFKIDNIQTDVDAIEVTLANISLVIDDLIRYQRNKSVINPLTNTLTIYKDNGTDPLTVFDLKDSDGIASVVSIFQRIPQ